MLNKRKETAKTSPKPNLRKPLWPMRINKYLAKEGISTRREADEFITRGLVTINGTRAKVGDLVNKTDTVSVDAKLLGRTFTYLAYHKPVGVATHRSTPNETDVKSTLKLDRDIFPVGRLDKNSSGLIILTNDGRITDALLNPDKNHEKEYVVTVNKTVTPEMIKKLESGIRIEGYKTKKAKVRKTGDKEVTIIITEGKKHQIRRMVVACGYEVVKLIRTRIMNIELKDLKLGTYRKIEGEELIRFLNELK